MWAWPDGCRSSLGFKTLTRALEPSARRRTILPHLGFACCCPNKVDVRVADGWVMKMGQGPRSTHRSVLDQVVPDGGATVVLLDQVHLNGVSVLSHLPFELRCAGFT